MGDGVGVVQPSALKMRIILMSRKLRGKHDLLFSGNFLLPGRLVIDDAAAFRKSAMRLIEFSRPAYLLTSPADTLNSTLRGMPTGWGLTTPRTAARTIQRNLLALPAALAGFDGFCARHANCILSNPTRGRWLRRLRVGDRSFR